MVLDNGWFTEKDSQGGTAFSLKVCEKLHEENTPYQTIAIYQTETFGRLMVIDSTIMLSSRDNFIYHEMMAHPILFTHPAPRRIVIIGGGDCGTLSEVLKHRQVEQVTQVDIDERVTRLSEHYFPELCRSNKDPRVRFHFGDGIRWIKDAPAGSIDAIIVDSTDPVGPAEGLFNAAFYRDCATALKADGLLVQQTESPFLHEPLFRAIQGAMRKSGFLSVRALHFPQPVYPSGWWSATLAGKRPGSLAPPPTADDLQNFKLKYYNADIHLAALAQPAFLIS